MEGEGIPYPHLHHRHSRGELKGEMVVGGGGLIQGRAVIFVRGTEQDGIWGEGDLRW